MIRRLLRFYYRLKDKDTFEIKCLKTRTKVHRKGDYLAIGSWLLVSDDSSEQKFILV